ncbi:uncharacterized protein LOC116850738 [Odontomachus brunneus]|nr:uncharacterized protein LOC116850733 isoform X2 [Odontomachus brunneus]XP_032685242.1 uncharacterized protein LOC116850735 [Odontomachus brunneus]XP_032685243.1 uncharacterized protein LOC116850736 [Odontomachus brunneus]XP_032685244.1 uncharacterized protein LOC116850737 [Odontomachus brunneus]XP_032685246.1 uncharacterized protein LOC116850738 [Odontomachus brunneus]
MYPQDFELIICAKSCFKCYRQINLKPCVICYSANFCEDHQMLFNLEHKDNCKELLLSLNINIACIKDNILHFCLGKLEFTKFPDARPYHNMITFINRYLVMENLDNIKKKLYSPIQSFWTLEHYVCSDYVTGPLTLHYALQESKLLFLPRNDYIFIVHIIDASKTDVICLKVWHIFLHIFSNIKELYIVFIKSPIFDSCELGTVCSRCRNYNQKLYVENVSEPYHRYACLKSFKQPNVIIIQDTHLYMVGTWRESIPTIIAQKCPLLFTTFDIGELNYVREKMQEVTGATRNQLYRKNKFRSYRPCKNRIINGLYYRNAHFIMYL